jgi:two-component system phosphate regulon response regulator PhoB
MVLFRFVAIRARLKMVSVPTTASSESRGLAMKRDVTPKIIEYTKPEGDGEFMPQPRILIIEDERGLIQSLTWYFNREGYETIVATDGQEGLRKAQNIVPDVVLLDLMLPGMGGLDVCRELRGSDRTREIPIIMITARAEESDQVVGFSMGADDYVTKPFSNKILLQRIKALLRRVEGGAETTDNIEHLSICIDRIRHQVTVNKEKIELTPTEFRLLECMLRQPGRAFSRHQLMDAAIGEGSIVLERTIDVHVKTLRRKLGVAGADSEVIETVRGVGYRFREGPSDEKARKAE